MRLIIRLFCFIRKKSVPFSLDITGFSFSVYRFQEQPNDFFTDATIATVARKLGCTVSPFRMLMILFRINLSLLTSCVSSMVISSTVIRLSRRVGCVKLFEILNLELSQNVQIMRILGTWVPMANARLIYEKSRLKTLLREKRNG